MFELITPLSYWILAILWLVILGLYLGRLRQLKTANGAIAVLLTILALDAFRTLFESAYFGLYFNSEFGLLPASIGVTLGRPELVIIPKLINIGAGALVLFLLVRRWIPREIKAREEAIERLRSNEELYRDLVESSDDLVTRADPSGKLTFVNFKAREIFGLLPNECIGRSAMEFIHVDDRAKLIDAYREWMREKPKHVTHENRQVSRSGEIRHLLWTVSPHFDAKGNLTHMNNVGRDITERKHAEEQQLLLATAVEQAAESIIIAGVNGRIEYVNPAFEAHTGYSREEATGANARDFQGGHLDDEFFSEIRDTLDKGQVWTGRLSYEIKDGSVLLEESTISPVQNAHGEVVHYVAVSRDITREAELETRLIQGQKMEAIGTLAGGISHDFNNLLQVILGYLDLARASIPKESQASGYLEKVRIAGDRATDLVNQILAFSRQSKHERKPLWLQLVLAEVLKLLRSSIPSTIEIRESIDASCGRVMADTTAMHQVAMNLCTNAYHAMRETGGVLEISLEEVTMDLASASQIPGLEEGSQVRLSVRDTGAGMSAATMERIFDPYFTTKDVGEGTGLGLAIVRGIVEGCGGAVTVESELGVGTVFEVYFPVCLPTPEDEGARANEGIQVTGTERLLVVDDEPMVAEQARLGLESLGYRVETSTSSLEAMEIIRASPDRFDVVITDQTMPHMTGMELAKELMRLRPGVAVILCTGFSELVDEADARDAGIRKFLKKPVMPRAIATAIRCIMDEEGHSSE